MVRCGRLGVEVTETAQVTGAGMRQAMEEQAVRLGRLKEKAGHSEEATDSAGHPRWPTQNVRRWRLGDEVREKAPTIGAWVRQPLQERAGCTEEVAHVMGRSGGVTQKTRPGKTGDVVTETAQAIGAWKR